MPGLCHEAAGDASVILVKWHDPLDGGTCVGPGFVGKSTFSDQSGLYFCDIYGAGHGPGKHGCGDLVVSGLLQEKRENRRCIEDETIHVSRPHGALG